ncbi:MAG: hypothetical protein ACF8R9_08185 [Phycisphaerales bacterium JB054]
MKLFRAAVLICGIVILIGAGIGWSVAGRMGLLHGPTTAALGFGENWSESAIAESQAGGDTIIAAIERFRAAHDGELPASLDSLVPAYVSAIKSPTAGDGQWRFGPLKGHAGEYYLSVRSRFMNKPGYHGVEWMQYNSLDMRWEVFRDESLLFD